jgi:CheY-like chemotaxis protein
MARSMLTWTKTEFAVHFCKPPRAEVRHKKWAAGRTCRDLTARSRRAGLDTRRRAASFAAELGRKRQTLKPESAKEAGRVFAPSSSVEGKNAPMSHRILVVDDDQNSRAMTVRWLHRMGHGTLETATAEAALDIVFMEEPELVLARVELPRMNGLELTIRLKQNPKTAYVPIVLYSAASERKDAALKAGAFTWMNYPASFAELAAAVAAALKTKS